MPFRPQLVFQESCARNDGLPIAHVRAHGKGAVAYADRHVVVRIDRLRLEPGLTQPQLARESMQLRKGIGYQVAPELAAPGNLLVVDVDSHACFRANYYA